MTLLSRLPLRAMLTVPFVGLVLLLALLIGLLSYRAGRDALDTWSEQLLIETVKRIEQAVALHVSGSAAVLEAAFPRGMPAPASIDHDLDALRTRFWLATSVHRDPNNYAYYGDREGHFFGLWRFSETEAELRLRTAHDDTRRIYRFTGIDGDLGTPVVESTRFDPRDRPWYKAGQSNPLHTWTSVYIDFRTRELVATRARRVNDRSGEFQGVVATDLSLRHINEFVRRLALSTNGVALVAEPGGLLVGVSRGPHLLETGGDQGRRLSATESPVPLVAATFRAVSQQIGEEGASEARTGDFTLADGQVVQAGFSRLRDDAGLDWYVMVAVPRDDFIHRVKDSFRLNLVLGGVAAIGVALLGLWVLGTIVDELRALAVAARRIGQGDLDTPPLALGRDDELGDLARTFADMQARLLTDHLTGLSNRSAAIRHIEERILQQRRRGDPRPFALLFVDLDRFKQVNDRFGHDVGDRVLCEVAARIRAVVPLPGLVARYAGDEFLVLLDGIDAQRDGERKRAELEQRLREPLPWLGDDDDRTIGGASIGLAIHPVDGRDVDTLIRAADLDMYRRKEASRGAT